MKWIFFFKKMLLIHENLNPDWLFSIIFRLYYVAAPLQVLHLRYKRRKNKYFEMEKYFVKGLVLECSQ